MDRRMSTTCSAFCLKPDRPSLEAIVHHLRSKGYSVKISSNEFAANGKKSVVGWPYWEWDFDLNNEDDEWILSGTIHLAGEKDAFEYNQYMSGWKTDIQSLEESPSRSKVLLHLSRTKWTMYVSFNVRNSPNRNRNRNVQDEFLDYLDEYCGAIAYWDNLQNFVDSEN